MYLFICTILDIVEHTWNHSYEFFGFSSKSLSLVTIIRDLVTRWLCLVTLFVIRVLLGWPSHIQSFLFYFFKCLTHLSFINLCLGCSVWLGLPQSCLKVSCGETQCWFVDEVVECCLRYVGRPQSLAS